MSLQNFPSFFLDSSHWDMKGENSHSYGFGRFTLDVSEQRLSDGSSQISLTPKAFDVLSFLVQNAGHLVEKEELMKHVWPDSFVEESNVARIVHTLRRKLGDDGNGNSFIETIPTKGYRFVADVEIRKDPVDKAPKADASIDESTTVEPAVIDATETRTQTNHRRQYFVLATVVVLFFLVTGFWFWNRSRTSFRGAGHSMNGEAYSQFRKGKSLVEERKPQEALEHFEKAIELDPYYAEAYAAKAAVLSNRRDGPSTNDDISTARAAVKKALALDPNNANAHTVNCKIIGTNDWEFEEAVTECQHAVELDPNDAAARREYGLALAVVGRQDESLDQLDRAIALSPTSANKFARGTVLYFSRHYAEAIDAFEQIEATEPGFKQELHWLMLCFAMKTDQAKALEYLIKTQEATDISPEDLNAVKAASVSGGWPAALRVTLDAATGFGRRGNSNITADLFAQIGEKDKAFEVLDDLRKTRKFGLLGVARDPMLDPIRDDPRYASILSEMNLK